MSNNVCIQLKIKLTDITDPIVWREILVPVDYNFDQLHHIIQAAFGWRSSHLYMFAENGFQDLITISSPFDTEACVNAQKVAIFPILNNLHSRKILSGQSAGMKYIYDYGDSWEHEISTVGFVDAAKAEIKLLDGEGACPPEDCGGIYGFSDLKKCLKTNLPSEIHGESWIPWLNNMGYLNYDPNVFDLKKARKRLSMLY